MESNFKNNLRKFRATYNLTQQDMANRLRIKRARYGSYEEGRAEPTIGEYFLFCKMMNITNPESFYKDESYMEATVTTNDARLNLILGNIINSFNEVDKSFERLGNHVLLLNIQKDKHEG